MNRVKRELRFCQQCVSSDILNKLTLNFRWTLLTWLNDQYLQSSVWHDWDDACKSWTSSGDNKCIEWSNGYKLTGNRCVSVSYY
jgi:hypothetical protein